MGMVLRHSAFSLLVSLMLAGSGEICAAQLSKETPSTASDAAQKAATLAENGHCNQALPLLKKTIRQAPEKELKKRLGLDGVHCAMTHSAPYDSLDFLAVLSRESPRDPEVLYAVTHAF